METKLTFRIALALAAPYSWLPASILPFLYGSLLSVLFGYPFEAWLFCLLLALVLCMHISANVWSDYADFIKGADSKEDNVEESDQILVYNKVPPVKVFFFAASMLALAAVLGIAVVLRSGLAPLYVGAAGGACVVLYSLGFLPIAYLPLGEAVSGFVMGILIPLGVIASFSGKIVLETVIYAVPFALGIGMIMFTNNICDIEKDTVSGRRTLPRLVGRGAARVLYRVGAAVWLACAALICFFEFREGVFALGIALFFGIPSIVSLFRARVFPRKRIAAMGNIVKANLAINGGVVLALAFKLILA